MDTLKAAVSALAILVVQTILLMWLNTFTFMTGFFLQHVQVSLGIVSYLILLILTYWVSRGYYFRDYKISDPVKEGLELGIFLSAVSSLFFLSAYGLNGTFSEYMGFLFFAVALIPAITTIVAIDAKTSKKKKFWFF